MRTHTSILMYHALSEKQESNTYIFDKNSFLTHLETLHRNGYTSILADEYYQALADHSYAFSQKHIVITFDDGHESDYTIALPLLKKYNFKATFLITTDWIGRPRHMTKEQLRILKKEGMSIQSHGKSHSFLDAMGREEIYHELDYSKKVLEDILDDRVSFISFPGGRYNQKVINSARGIPYLALFSSRPFSLQKYNGIYLIGRYCMKQPMHKSRFEKILSMDVYMKIKALAFYYGKHFLKRGLGNRNYYIFWEKLGKFK